MGYAYGGEQKARGGGGRRRDTGVDRARLRFVDSLPVVGSLPVGAGSPDLSGKI
jgi:hypothetical protein